MGGECGGREGESPEGGGVNIFTGAEPDEVWPLIKDYHYSRRMPSNIQYVYTLRKPGGLFGDTGAIEAAIIFSIPPTRWSENVLELSRLVRLPECDSALSRLIGLACDALRKHHVALLVSFADRTHNHHGGIYQASGWKYDGLRDRQMDGLIINGKFVPGRSCNNRYGTRSPDRLRKQAPELDVQPHYDEGKHLYWRPLSVAGKSRAKALGLQSKPYPKPNADGPQDERLPSRASYVQPVASAPIISFQA